MSSYDEGSFDAEELVSASDIAERADVGASAVSNWRRRFPDFPRPFGSAPSGGDLFRWTEVEAWLDARGKRSVSKVGARLQLFQLASRLRGRVLAGDIGGTVALVAALHCIAQDLGYKLTSNAPIRELEVEVRKIIGQVEKERPDLTDVFEPVLQLEPEDMRLLLDTMPDFDSRASLAAAVDHVLTRSSRYGDFRTEPQIANLLADIAEVAGSVGIAFDPAAGSGELLLAAATVNTELLGQELMPDVWRLAIARSLLNDVPMKLVVGDSLAHDAYPSLKANVVFCEPPSAVRVSDDQGAAGDPRWQILGEFERPSTRASDFAWLAHVIHHLAPSGRGFVLLRAGSLFQGGAQARMRAELLRRGTIEAIVSLPDTLDGKGAMTQALWVVRAPRKDPPDVLLIAGEGAPARSRAEVIAKTFSDWLRHGSELERVAEFVVTQPVLELLGGDAALTPSRWVHGPDAVEPSEWVLTTERARENVHTSLDRRPPEGLPDFSLSELNQPRPRVRIHELVESGRATIVRASRIKAKEYQDHGVPVWVPGDVRPSWEREETPKYADPDDVDSRSITQPGDIVLTTVGGLRTRVDEEGGHLLGTSLQALRLATNSLNPRAVAALLAAEPNTRLMTGSTIPRVNVGELEIPILDEVETAQLIHLLDAIDREQESAHGILASASELRSSLLSALSTGATALSAGEQDKR